jgi:putative heme-binding domain-containing protein
MNRRFLLAAGLMVWLGSTGVRGGQEPHTLSPEAVENGGKIFLSSCAKCHGATGDDVPGVNLAGGRFLRATTDADLAALIVKGIPGTGMPSNNLSDKQAGDVVAFIRSFASGGLAAEMAGASVAKALASLPGDAGRGKALVEGKGQCLTCHTLGSAGGRLGPDLSEIGIRRPDHLQRSILEPEAEIRGDQRTARVVTRDGVVTTGRLLNHDNFSAQLLDSKEQLRSFLKAELKEFTILTTSPMLSYRDRLTSDEVADIVKYFSTLRGRR